MTLDVSRLKLWHESQVWHIGTMNVQDKGWCGPSYEGTGLSVSRHPDAWEAIAKLGGLPRFELRRAGGRFLDFHRLTADSRLQLIRWGCEQGWAEMQWQFAVSEFDEELGASRTTNYVLESEAREAFDELSEEESREPHFAPVEVAVATPAMEERLCFQLQPGTDVFDYLVTFWVEDHTELDGVWWEDDLAPESLSAPRCVILARSLPCWQCTRL